MTDHRDSDSPGWYQDPESPQDSSKQRWWDGTQWTDLNSQDGTQSGPSQQTQMVSGQLTCDGEKIRYCITFWGRQQTRSMKLSKLNTVKVGRSKDGSLSMELGIANVLKNLTIAQCLANLAELSPHRPEFHVEAFSTEVADALRSGGVTVSITDMEPIREQAAVDKATDKARRAQEAIVKMVQRQARVAATPKVLVKKYKGEREFQRDAEKMYKTGWRIEGQSTRKQLYSLGTGIFTKKGISTVTWLKPGVQPSSDPVPDNTQHEDGDIPEQIAKLASLRDSGVLTSEEFDAKKAELLARM